MKKYFLVLLFIFFPWIVYWGVTDKSHCLQNMQIDNVYFDDICDDSFKSKSEEFKQLEVRKQYFDNRISSNLDTQRALKIEKIVEKFIRDNSDKIIANQNKLVKEIAIKTKEIESEETLYALKYLSLLIDYSKQYKIVEIDRFNKWHNLNLLQPNTYTFENIEWWKWYQLNLWNSAGTYILKPNSDLEIHIIDKNPLYVGSNTKNEIKIYENGILKAHSKGLKLIPGYDDLLGKWYFNIDIYDSWLVTYGNLMKSKWYIDGKIYDVFYDILKLEESQITRWYVSSINNNMVTFTETIWIGGFWVNENGYENFIIDLDSVKVIWKSFVEPIDLDNLDLTSYEIKMMNKVWIVPNNSWYHYYDHWDESSKQIINPNIIESRKDIKNIKVKDFWNGYVEIISINDQQ